MLGAGVGLGTNPKRRPFDSRLVSGYVADFDSRYGVTDDGTGLCSQWNERWGNGMSFTQATQAKRPAITINAWGATTAITGNGTSTALTGNTAAKSIIRNTGAYTVYLLFRPTHSISNGYVLNTSINSAGGTTRSIVGSGNTAAQMYGGGRIGDTGVAGVVIGPRAGLPYIYPFTAIVDHANAAGYLYRNNVLVAQNSALLTSGSIPDTSSALAALLSNVDGTGGWFGGDLVRMVVCNGAHTEQQRASTWAGIMSEYPGQSLPFKDHTPSLLVQMHGDSLTQGSAMPIRTPDLPLRVWQQLGYTNDKLVINLGRSGATAANSNTDRPNFVDILPASSGTKVVYVLLIGINDIAAGTTGATVYNTIKTGFQAAQVARPGIKVLICTPIACGSITSGQQAELVNLRDLILSNAVSDGADGVRDLGGLSQFLTSNQALANDTTYYLADKLHLNDTGNQIIAANIAAGINTL